MRRPTSEPIGFHVTMRLMDNRPIARTVADLRAIARVVHTQGERRGLLAFGTADDHLHAALVTSRASSGDFAQYVEIALRWRLGLGARFDPARIRPLEDQGHAYNTFHYVHRQDARHALGRDGFGEGTSVPDLLGLRLVNVSICARVRQYLPRVRREDLVSRFPPGVFDEDRRVALEVLAEAAAAVFALANLEGRSSDAPRARRAAVHVAGPEVATKVLSDCLGIRPRAVQVLRALPSEPLVVRAVRMQALLRSTAENQVLGHAEPALRNVSG